MSLTLVLGLAAERAHGADAPATEFVAPADAGIVNVTQPPYNAVPDDGKDDTTAIQKALDDHANAEQIIYLPDGEYLISDTLRWPEGPHGGTAWKRTIMQGQSRDRTVVQLKDNCPGFNDPDKPKAMVWTGRKPAQRFRNGIRTVTFDTGKGNPGAIGVQYIANNQGSVRHVLIRSGDGSGPIGLDLGYTDEQGPCLIKGVTVDGFDVGVSARTVVDSITIEGLILRGQNRVGLSNSGQCISIRGLQSVNSVPAIENTDINGLITLIDSKLTGEGNAGELPAFHNAEGAARLQNVEITGYAIGVRNEAGQGTKQNAPAERIGLYVTHEPFTTTGKTDRARVVHLPIRETPIAPQPPVEKWAGPHQFGGNPGDKEDDTAAIQKAVDSGAEVIYLPHAGKGGWRVDGEVVLRGNVRRFTHLEGRIGGSGTIKVADGAPDTVVLDRFDLLYTGVSLENASDRTMVLSGITMGKGRIRITGKGDLFLEDVCGGPLVFNGINVWARQINPEPKQTKITVDGGSLWCLGLKTEQHGTIVHARNGARVDIAGGFIYAQGAPKKNPMFVVEGADTAFSASVGETTWNRRNYKTILSVTRNGQTEALEYGKPIYWRNNRAAMLPLIMAIP